MKRIILDNSDGTVAVLIPAACGLSVEEVAEKDCLGKPYEIVNTTIIPSDRYFRSAWKVKVGGVDVDMDRARDVHMNQIRNKRDEKLKELDIEQFKGDDVTLEKQALRDLPAMYDLSMAETPEDLKALWPSELT